MSTCGCTVPIIMHSKRLMTDLCKQQLVLTWCELAVLILCCRKLATAAEAQMAATPSCGCLAQHKMTCGRPSTGGMELA
jgi:hypothetical protein